MHVVVVDPGMVGKGGHHLAINRFFVSPDQDKRPSSSHFDIHVFYSGHRRRTVGIPDLCLFPIHAAGSLYQHSKKICNL